MQLLQFLFMTVHQESVVQYERSCRTRDFFKEIINPYGYVQLNLTPFSAELQTDKTKVWFFTQKNTKGHITNFSVAALADVFVELLV